MANSADNSIAEACSILDQEAKALRILSQALQQTPGPFNDCVHHILTLDGKVVVTGIGKSGLVGAKIAATLASTGTPAQFMHTGDASHGDLGMISPGDIILALSNSGQSRELLPIIAYAKRWAIPLVSITSGLTSPLAKASTTVLALPQLAEACPLGLAPMTSTTMQLALGDALAGALITARGFSQEDFAARHTGGSLGLRTKSIEDYFSDQANTDNVPSVPPDAPLVQIVQAITNGRKGAVVVAEDLDTSVVGLVTEGDVTRAIAGGNIGITAREIMTANPIALPASALLVDAVTTLRTRKVNVLLVHRQAPQGPQLLHIQDLLALGL